MRSKVKWFDNRRGFGFILNPNNGEDIFVHYENMDDPGYKTLKENDDVEFEIEKTAKGLQAKHVKSLKNLQTIL